MAVPPQLEKQFDRLVSEWKEQRRSYSSDPLELATCEPYQRIIAMGPVAIPLILRELERQPDHWFLALETLANWNPVLPSHAGALMEMANDWIEWGIDNGHLRK